MPTELIVQGWARLDPAHDPIASFSTTVVVDSTGRFQLDVPAVLLDLRIAATGYAAEYRWGLRPERGKLGTLRLKAGSSVSGFVVDAVDGLPATGARVVAMPAGMVGDEPTRRRRARAIPSAETNERGFFQLTGLAPGNYRLEASVAGRPASSLEPVEIGADAESLLSEALVLAAPISVELRVTPATGAEGSPWLVTLVPRVTTIDGPHTFEHRVDTNGFVRFEGLGAQTYRLLVGNDEGSLVEERTVIIDRDTTLEIALPLVTVLGTVRLEDRPIEARLRFETGARDRVFLESDEDGAFSGWIRRPEHQVLLVRIEAHDPRFERRVTIREPEVRRDTIRLDLDLAGSDVHGDVVDQDGRTLKDVRVALYQGGNDVAGARTGDAGAFLLVAVAPGTYRLMARHPEHGDAEPVSLEIVRGRTLSNQRLVLTERVDLEGRVRSSSGQPLAGVTYELVTVGPFPAVSARRQTDLEGRFRARIGAQASHVVVRIYAPGQVLWSGCLPVAVDRPLDIVLPPAPGGQLTVQLEGDSEMPPLTRGRLVLFGDQGGFFDWGDLIHWQAQTNTPGQTHEGTAIIDVLRIAADRRYGVLWSTDPWPIVAAQACGLGPVPDIDWRYMSLGGSLSISLDVSALQRDRGTPTP